MNEAEKDQEPIKVRDRRRFDAEGNLRTESTDASIKEEAPPHQPQGGQPTSNDGSEAARLQQELDAARKRVDELARAFQALNADREEFKQRLTRERERMINVEKGTVASALLDVLDELDLSLSASADDNSPLAHGIRLIREGLLKKIQAMGIERLEVVGQTFDPKLAEATDMEVTTDPAEDQRVVAVVRAGYRLNEHIIRPARVKVAKYMSPANA